MNMRLLLVAAASVTLGACATVPDDRGSGHSVELLKSRSSLAAEARFAAHGNVDELLSQPLDADAAVRVALNRNAHMQGLYAQLGLAQAEVYDASRLSNPTLGFMRLSADAGAKTTWSLTQGFTELLFINYRTRVGRSQVLQAQQQVAQSVLDLEASVRSAYYQYVAAVLAARLHEQSSIAAQASADYARSLFTAGNISELQLSREQAAASRARIEWQAALTSAQQRQGELLTLMGISITDAPEFIERLDVPAALTLDAAALQRWATQQRMDLSILRERDALYSSMQTHTRRWFWLSDAQLELEREREADGEWSNGIGGSVGLPLFNHGKGARLRAQSQLEEIRAERAALQLAISNDVIVQMDSLQRAAQVVDEYRQRLVPLQETVLRISQQQQNYMFIGAFELLSERREVLQVYQDYLNATADYWLQYVSLSKTAGGRLPDSTGEASIGLSVGVEALPAAPEVPAVPPPNEEPTDEHAEHSHQHLHDGATP